MNKNPLVLYNVKMIKAVNKYNTLIDETPELDNNKCKDYVSPTIHPSCLEEYIGQKRAKLILNDAIVSAQKRSVPLNHIMITSCGPGVGKTTLSKLIADRMGVKCVTAVGSMIENYNDIFNLFSQVRNTDNPIIIIDEIHRLKPALCETMYLAMEDFNSVFKKNVDFGACGDISFRVGPFTLIGLSAGEQGFLPRPFLDRFDIKITLQKYTMEDMIKIVKQSSEKMAIKLSDNIIKSVAERSVFTPRIANNLLKRILDYKTSRDIKSIADKDIKKIFDMLGIDNIGLDEVARKVLTALANSSRGTCGVNSLASIVNVEQSTLKNIIEPQLLMHELIVYQSRGRAITSAGLKHLGREDIINKTKEAR